MTSKTARIITILVSVVLFCALYFGFSTVDTGKKAKLDQQRSLSSEVTNEAVLLKEANKVLSADTAQLVDRLRHLLESNSIDSISKNETLKKLSGIWFATGHFGLAGINAEAVAVQEKTAEAWSIAGTTYINGIRSLAEGKEKEFCVAHAVSSLEKAISIEPEQTDYRINLATVYTEAPPKENPMKGIQMLLQLNEKEPNNIAVLNRLGQLAIKTGQFDKAVTRLEKSLAIMPGNIETLCLLSIAYDGAGQHEKAAEFAAKCK